MNKTDPWAVPASATPVYEPWPSAGPAGRQLCPQWAGWTPVPWADDKLPPKPGQQGYAGHRAVFVSDTTGEVIGSSPQPPVGGTTFEHDQSGYGYWEHDPATGGPKY